MSVTSTTKNMAKKAVKKKVRKWVMTAISPFIPYIVFISALFIMLLLIIDAVYIQFVQSDDDLLSKDELKTKQYLIEQVEQYNSDNDFDDGKSVSWSEIYAILTFFNISNGEEITQDLIDKVVKDLKSAYYYIDSTIKTENKNENGEWVIASEETVKLLTESNTIKGHYKYHYKEVVKETETARVTMQELLSEELIGDQYAMLKDYLKKEFKIKDNDLDTQIAIVLEAGKGFYDNSENTKWLIENSNYDFSQYVNGILMWPLPPEYTYISSPYGYRVHPITRCIFFS